MIDYIIFDSSGKILRTLRTDSEVEVDYYRSLEGISVTTGVAECGVHCIRGGRVVLIPPSSENLDVLKANRRAIIKSRRKSIEYGGLVFEGNTYDTDEYSQNKIMGAIQLCLLAPEDYELDWTLADNTVVTLTKSQMISVGVALGQHIQNAFNTGRDLQAMIDSATTSEEVEAIVWPE